MTHIHALNARKFSISGADRTQERNLWGGLSSYRLPITLTGILALALMSITSEAAAAPTRINTCTTISNSGSYILSRNINGTAALTDCVVIDAPYVTLNLNGFAIGGPGVIGGGSPADGIFVSAGNTNVTIRNGSLTGWINGIVFDIDTDGAAVEGIRSHENVNSGMQVLGSGALIRHNITHDNPVASILFWITAQ